MVGILVDDVLDYPFVGLLLLSTLSWRERHRSNVNDVSQNINQPSISLSLPLNLNSTEP